MIRLREGDIILVYNKKNFFSKLIWKISSLISKVPKVYRDKKVSHVSLYIGGDLIAETTVDRGLNASHINKYKTKKYKIQVGRVLKDFDKKLLLKYAKEDLGSGKYSYIQIFTLALSTIWYGLTNKDMSPKSEHCSEWVAKTFGKVSIKFCDKDYWATTPIDILLSNIIRIYNEKEVIKLADKEIINKTFSSPGIKDIWKPSQGKRVIIEKVNIFGHCVATSDNPFEIKIELKVNNEWKFIGGLRVISNESLDLQLHFPGGLESSIGDGANALLRTNISSNLDHKVYIAAIGNSF